MFRHLGKHLMKQGNHYKILLCKILYFVGGMRLLADRRVGGCTKDQEMMTVQGSVRRPPHSHLLIHSWPEDDIPCLCWNMSPWLPNLINIWKTNCCADGNNKVWIWYSRFSRWSRVDLWHHNTFRHSRRFRLSRIQTRQWINMCSIVLHRQLVRLMGL
jgi:hypothetical protein